MVSSKNLNAAYKYETNFPVALLGASNDVNLKIRKIVRTAWKQGSWGTALRSLELTECPTTSELWLDADSEFPKSSIDCWRLYSIGYAMRKMIDGNYTQANLRKYDVLMLSGMDNLWFTLGTLYLRYGSLFLRERIREESHVAVLTSYLSKFIHWLPGICERDFYFRGPQRPTSPGEGNYSRYYYWQTSVAAILYDLGWPIDQDKRIPYSRDALIEYIVTHQIAEVVNGKLVLKNAVPAPLA